MLRSLEAQMGNQRKHQTSRILREIFLRLFNTALDPEQNSGLPLVQLAQLVELEQFISEKLLITSLHGLQQVNEELVLACRLEGRVKLAV